jgi:hypothetical protein
LVCFERLFVFFGWVAGFLWFMFWGAVCQVMMLFGGGRLSIEFLGIGTFSVSWFWSFYGCCFVLGFGVEVEVYLRFCFEVFIFGS